MVFFSLPMYTFFKTLHIKRLTASSVNTQLCASNTPGLLPFRKINNFCTCSYSIRSRNEKCAKNENTIQYITAQDKSLKHVFKKKKKRTLNQKTTQSPVKFSFTTNRPDRYVENKQYVYFFLQLLVNLLQEIAVC